MDVADSDLNTNLSDLPSSSSEPGTKMGLPSPPVQLDATTFANCDPRSAELPPETSQFEANPESPGVIAQVFKNLNLRSSPLKEIYELPSFGGSAVEWAVFKAHYKTSVMDFEPHENIARLSAALYGPARTVVDHLLRTSNDPEVIMRALECEYGDPMLRLDYALRCLRALPHLDHPNARKLRRFAAAVKNVVRILKAIKGESYLRDPQLVNELIGKLTPTQCAQYTNYAFRICQEENIDLWTSPNLEYVAAFLEEKD